MYVKKLSNITVLIILYKGVLSFAPLIVIIIPATDRKILLSRIGLHFHHSGSNLKWLTTASATNVFLTIKKKWREEYFRFSYQVSYSLLSHVLF